MVHDKTALRYGDLISPLSRTLGQPDFVIVVLVQKYLQSPYCMTELHALTKTPGSKSKIPQRIIPLASARRRAESAPGAIAPPLAEYWQMITYNVLAIKYNAPVHLILRHELQEASLHSHH